MNIENELVKRIFVSMCKKAIDIERSSVLREYGRLKKRETQIDSELETVVSELSITDAYDFEFTKFTLFDNEILIEDDELTAALMELPEMHRKIVLLAYAEELNDREIGELIGKVRSTVQKHRTNGLCQLRKHYERSKKKMNEDMRDYKKTFNYCDLANASKGCEESIDLILECFDALISKAATRELSDEYGNRYSYKDEYMNGRIKGRLISTILNFKTDLAKDRIADWNL